MINNSNKTYKVVYVDCTWELNNPYSDWNPIQNDLGYKTLLLTVGVGLDSDKFDLFKFYLTHIDYFDIKDYSDSDNVWVVKGDFNWHGVMEILNAFINNCHPEHYRETFSKIRKRMSWEFEGYDDVEPVEKELVTWIDLDPN